MALAFSGSVRAGSDHDPAKQPGSCEKFIADPMLVKFCLDDERYIDDIPFNTKEVYREACCEHGFTGNGFVDFMLEEEAYIDDIPFNTGSVAESVIYGSMHEFVEEIPFELEEEEYIDDIPWEKDENSVDSLIDNEKEKIKEEEYIITSFVLDDEEYIDDIPWDTQRLLANVMKYPEPARKYNMEGMVLVSFSYGEDGYINVNAVNASNDELKDHVVSQLEEIRLSRGIVDTHKEYIARFDFKLR